MSAGPKAMMLRNDAAVDLILVKLSSFYWYHKWLQRWQAIGEHSRNPGRSTENVILHARATGPQQNVGSELQNVLATLTRINEGPIPLPPLVGSLTPKTQNPINCAQHPPDTGAVEQAAA